jgi:glucokinase
MTHSPTVNRDWPYAYPVSVVLELAGSLEKVQAEHVGEACRMGDRLAEAILRQTADLLVVWLGNMIDLLEPDAIVLGGGVTELIGPFLDYIASKCVSRGTRPDLYS